MGSDVKSSFEELHSINPSRMIMRISIITQVWKKNWLVLPKWLSKQEEKLQQHHHPKLVVPVQVQLWRQRDWWFGNCRRPLDTKGRVSYIEQPTVINSGNERFHPYPFGIGGVSYQQVLEQIQKESNQCIQAKRRCKLW